MTTEENPIFARYILLPETARETLVRWMVETGTMSEEFCLRALDWETAPSIQWFLIKAAGLVKSLRAVTRILDICRKPDNEFANMSGTVGSIHLIGAWALGCIGSGCTESVLALVHDDNEETRKFAVDALGEIGDVRPAVLEALGQALENDSATVALWAALSMAKLGEPSLPILHRIIFSQDARRVAYALDAIVKIDSPQSRSFLAQFLAGASQEFRSLYLRTIEQNQNKPFNIQTG